MALGPRERKLFQKLTSEGLLDTPDLSLRPIPEYKRPDLSKIKLNLPSAPPSTTSQDFANYLLVSTTGDRKTASMFGNSLATREGAKTEGESFLSRLFDTLDITSDIGVNTAKNVVGLVTDDDFNPLDNLADIGKGIAGGALKFANDTVLKPTHWLADAVGREDYTETMNEWEEKLLPDQEGSQILKDAGVDNKFIQGFGGMGIDIALDPLTYLGFGAAKHIGRGAKPAEIITEKAAASSPEAFLKGAPKRPMMPRGSVAEDALQGNSIPNLSFQTPKLPHIQTPTSPLMDAAQDAQKFTPRTRKLQRKLEKAQASGGLTKAQRLSPEAQIPTPNPARDFIQKLERANNDYQRAMIRAGTVAEKGTNISVRAANEVAAKIAKGEVPRVIPIPKADPADAEVARTVADDFIDDLMGPKRGPKGTFARRTKVLEVNPGQQINLLSKVGAATDKSIEEVIPALKAAEDQMIALGVQPVWHNGLRVRLSDVLQSTVSAQAVGSKQMMSLNEVLADFIKKDVKKMNPITRSIIHGLMAQRSMNMSDIVQNISKYASKAATELPQMYMGRQLGAATEALEDTAVRHALRMGMTNKEARAIKDLIKDHVNVNKLPADQWIMSASKQLTDAVTEGRADAKLVNAFNKKVAKSIGVTSDNLQEKITGSRVADAIMTRVTTWWSKGPFQEEATSKFTYAERSAGERAKIMRHFARNTTKDERQAAWKVLRGDAGMSDDPRIAELGAFMQRYFDEVLKGPVTTGLQLANANTKHLSVAERSMTMMEDVNRHLKQLNGVKAFQFTNSRQVTRTIDGNKRVFRFNEDHDWMRSWQLAEPDDPINFIYDLDLALERTTMEYSFLDDFVDKFGSLTKDSTHNFAMPLSRIKGFYVPEEQGRQMIRLMADLDKGIWKPNSEAIRYYRSALKAWKTGVTIYLPSHHIRNAIGDLHLMWWAGHNDPRVFGKAKRVMGSQRTRYKHALKAGDFDDVRSLTDPQDLNAIDYAATAPEDVVISKNGVRLTADQIYTSAFQRGLLLDANTLEDIFGESTLSRFNWIPDRVKEPFKGKVHGGASQAAEYREHFIRLSHYISAVEKGLKKSKNLKQVMDEAAFEVKKWHPDGRDMTQFEQKYMRNLVPFYSWIRKSTPLMFETLMTRPAKVMAYPRGMVALQESLGIEGIDITDPFPDNQLFPEWLRGYGIGPIGDPLSDNPISRWWGLLGRNALGPDGQPIGYTMFNPSTPFIDTAQQFGGFGPADTGAGMLESLSPFLKIPIDLTKNSDFTGAPITKDEGGQGVLRYLAQQIPFAGPIQRTFDIGDKDREGVEEGRFDHEALINMLTAAGLRGTGPYIKGAEFEAKERLRRQREEGR